eukprot:4820555-Heterocapsa_arctica.AAC.1
MGQHSRQACSDTKHTTAKDCLLTSTLRNTRQVKPNTGEKTHTFLVGEIGQLVQPPEGRNVGREGRRQNKQTNAGEKCRNMPGMYTTQNHKYKFTS